MAKKTVLSIIGLVCLAAGIYSIVSDVGLKLAVYALLVIGALLFLGPIIGVRKVLSMVAFFAVSAIAYYLIVYLLGSIGVALQTKGKTVIAIVTILSVYIFSSSFAKRS